MSFDFQNPILQKIAEGAEAKVSPQIKKTYLAIVVSGMKVMFDPKTHRMLLQRLQGNVIQNVATGVSQLIALVAEHSKLPKQQLQQLFVPASVPAALVLMCYALDFAEQTMKQPITSDMAAQASHDTLMDVLHVFGIDQQKVNAAIQQKGQGAAPGAPPAVPTGLMGAQL